MKIGKLGLVAGDYDQKIGHNDWIEHSCDWVY